MEHLSNKNQDKKLFKKAYKKVQQNHEWVAKGKTSTKDVGKKATEGGKNQFRNKR